MGYVKYHKYPLPKRCRKNVIQDFQALFDELSPFSFKAKYQAEVFQSKYADPNPKLKELRVSRAIQKWMDTESRNFRTNQRLFLHDNGDKLLAGRSFDDWIDRASRLIQKVIGTRPPYSSLTGEFSGGASTSKRRQIGMVQRKYVGQQDVTERAWDHVWPHLLESPLWVRYNESVLQPNFVVSSILFTVPKNDTIDRVACKEPDYNMWAQKAVGNFFRRRLKRRCGVDLNDQSINRDLARDAVRLSLATVDLSSASDSVTTQLVCRLLPTEWFVYLQDLRVHSTLVKDHVHELEMFSSMGNGFTFELESLIFWALTRAVSAGTVSVYGDDLIMPIRDYPVVRTLLNYCGFVVNKDKSFATGLFRESCGGHYHDGADVTPFYVKEPVLCLTQLIRLLNRLRKWASANGSSSWASSDCWDLWKKYAQYVPKRFWGGTDLASIGTLVSKDGPADRLVRAKIRKESELFEVGSYIQSHAVADSTSPSSCAPKGLQRPTNKPPKVMGEVGRRCTIPANLARLLDESVTDVLRSRNHTPVSSQGVYLELAGYVTKRATDRGGIFGSERPLFLEEYL